MEEFDPFRNHPQLFWPVSTTKEVVFTLFAGGTVTCIADDMGRPIGSAPPDAVKFFRRTVTRFVNIKGHENYSALCTPNPHHKLYYIGIMCDREAAVERAFNGLQRRMLERHENGKFFINPVGVAWPFDEGDRVFHPDIFGLVVPPLSMRFVEE